MQQARDVGDRPHGKNSNTDQPRRKRRCTSRPRHTGKHVRIIHWRHKSRPVVGRTPGRQTQGRRDAGDADVHGSGRAGGAVAAGSGAGGGGGRCNDGARTRGMCARVPACRRSLTPIERAGTDFVRKRKKSPLYVPPIVG